MFCDAQSEPRDEPARFIFFRPLPMLEISNKPGPDTLTARWDGTFSQQRSIAIGKLAVR